MSTAFCRDCFADVPQDSRCPACHSPRVLGHPELGNLSIAHVDCDAFYAAVEKRDDPSLADKPVIVGGGRRGVVATCCYVARIRGVRSAMPMFKALAACPDAVVVRPRMAVYAEVSREIRAMMEALTPLVEPLSLDEAFLDLTGTERLHGAQPAVVLARLQRDIETAVGVTVSVGLSHNKFLAKMASERDKPRGFAVIGRAETDAFLLPLPVSALWGVGRAQAKAMRGAGIDTLADIRRVGEAEMTRRFGATGFRLHALALGRDERRVKPVRKAKSISAETTFDQDISDGDALQQRLWLLCVRVTDRLKAKGVAGHGLTLKLKRADFRILTRSQKLSAPTALADTLFRAAVPLLAAAQCEGPFRLLGIGVSDVVPLSDAVIPDLLDKQAVHRAKAELASDMIRQRFGSEAIVKGRGLRS